MRNNKAIEGFMEACLETAAKMGFRRSELDKLLQVLVVTRADLSARSSQRMIPMEFPIPDTSKISEVPKKVLE